MSYDLAQFSDGRDCADSTLWVASREAQPMHYPNGIEQMDAMASAIEKVFRQLDDVPLDPVGTA